MAEGELFRDLMHEEGDIAEVYERNPEQSERLLATFFMCAQTYAIKKGFKVQDLVLSTQGLTNDSEVVMFGFDESEEAKESRKGKILDITGNPL